MTLYGLLHARYIRTESGMQKVSAKYRRGLYGACPRAKCELQNALPMGICDVPAKSSVKTYCPKCKEVYDSHRLLKKIDGAFFGTGFPQQFLMAHPSLGQLEKEPFTGTVKGFRVHSSSFTHPLQVRYSPDANEYEAVPRPLARFNEDEKALECYKATRPSFVKTKPKEPKC